MYIHKKQNINISCHLLDSHKCWQWAKNLILSPCNLYSYSKIGICNRSHKCSPIHVFPSLAHRNVAFVAFLVYKEGHWLTLINKIWADWCVTSELRYLRDTVPLSVLYHTLQPHRFSFCPANPPDLSPVVFFFLSFFWFEYLHPCYHRDKG